MKSVLIYYSMLGNTDYVARKIAEKIKADVIRIEPETAYPDKGFKKFFWGGKGAVMGDKPVLKPYTFTAGEYDRIIFGTPVWAGTFAPPLRTFIEENRETLKDKKISVVACSGGGKADKAADRIKQLIGTDSSEAFLHLVDPKDKPDSENEKRIEEFCSKLTQGEEHTMYTPKPIDTSKITLPKEIEELTEEIAKNVHENWAVGRIADGWTYGEKRDDVKKTTPCLVPYDELSETEKEFDRVTAMESIKTILALGYKIEKI